MGEPLIELHGLTKTYGTGDAAYQALCGVDLTIHQGEFVAIMGPSGSGKSTLMNLLGCLDSPDSGSYRFKGIAVENLNKDQRSLIRRHALGFIFQGFNLLARTSALENVELPLLYRGYPRKQRHEMAHAALASVGLSDKKRNTPTELSGGQQQRGRHCPRHCDRSRHAFRRRTHRKPRFRHHQGNHGTALRPQFETRYLHHHGNARERGRRLCTPDHSCPRRAHFP